MAKKKRTRAAREAARAAREITRAEEAWYQQRIDGLSSSGNTEFKDRAIEAANSVAWRNAREAAEREVKDGS